MIYETNSARETYELGREIGLRAKRARSTPWREISVWARRFSHKG